MKKTVVRAVSFFLVLIVMLTTVCASYVGVFAAEVESENEIESTYSNVENSVFSEETKIEIQNKIDLGEQIFEIETLREENVKHFHLEDGSYQAIVYAEPVHRKNRDGQWETIDNTLSESGRFYATKDERVCFSQIVGENDNVFTLRENGYLVEVGLIDGKTATGVIESQNASRTFDNRLEELKNVEKYSAEVLYNNAFENADLTYIIESNSIKEAIIIREKTEGFDYTYTFRIALTGLNAALRNNTVVLTDSDSKEEKYLIPCPFMYDENEVSSDVEYRLVQQDEGIYLLSIIPNADWINDENRCFPVVIDPSLLDVGQTVDAYVNYPATTTNYGSAQELWVSDGNITYYRFATPHFPSGTVITSASVKAPYYYNVVNNNSILVNIYSITQDWEEQQVTWSNKPSTPVTRLDQQAVYASGALPNNPQYAIFGVTSYVQSWYTGTSNYGFALKRGGGTNSSVIFVAREKMQIYAQLVINYSGTHLAEGVYSIKKQNENTYLRSYIPENLGWILQDTTSYTAPPTTQEHFENLFKIAYRPEYDDYVIRSMLDNALVVYPSTYNNAPIAGRRTESDSSISTNYTWKLVYNSGYYNITYTKNGTTYYVKSLSTENNAKVVFTTNANDSGTKWSFCRYEGNACEAIVTDSAASQPLPGESFTYKAHMYSTQIGQNGPIAYSVTNIDGTTTNIATINASTGVLQAMKPGRIRVSASFTGTQNILYWDVVITKVVQITCYNNDGFWDVPNSATSQYVECNEENQLRRSAWFLEYQDNGFYVIRNYVTGYYLKNSNNNLVHYNNNNTSIDDTLLWNLIRLDDGSCRIQSKSDDRFFITEEDVSHSSQDPDIVLSNSNDGNRQKWFLIPKNFEIQMNTYYDYSYQVKMDGNSINTNNTMAMIDTYQKLLENYLFSEYGIIISYDTPTRIISYADLCHGITNINTQTVNSDCEHNNPACDGREDLCYHIISGTGSCTSSCNSPHHHNNSYKIHSYFCGSLDDATDINLMWTGHKNCVCEDTYIPLTSSGTNQKFTTVTLYNSPLTYWWKYAFFHELGHALGARGDDYCFSEECVMSYATDISMCVVLLNSLGSDTFCDACEMEIRSNVYNMY